MLRQYVNMKKVLYFLNINGKLIKNVGAGVYIPGNGSASLLGIMNYIIFGDFALNSIILCYIMYKLKFYLVS